MSSVIHYRFKAGSGEWSRIAFEGHALSLGELKRAIADQRKLNPQQQQAIAGAGTAPSAAGAATGEGGGGGRMLQDFELILSNHDTGEEYHGDQTMITKNSSVVVKRVPATRAKTLRIEAEAPDLLPFSPVAGPRQVPSSFDSPAFKRQKLGGAVQAVDAVQELQRRAGLSLGMGLDRGATDEFGDDPLDEFSYIQREEEKRQAEAKERQQQQLLRQQQEAAALQQQQLAAGMNAAAAGAQGVAVAAQPHPSHAFAAASGAAVPAAMAAPIPGVYARPPPNRPPPPHYVCHNCRQKGHWKQSCPTAAHLSAPSASKVIEQNARLAALIYAPRLNTGAPIPAAAVAAASQQDAVRAQQMSLLAALQQHQLVQQAPVEPAKPAIVTAPDLICTLCTRLFTNPMVVPCCFTSFCDECIRQALVLESARCPRCHSDAISADQLRPNTVMQRRVAKEQQRISEAQQGGGGGGGAAAPAASAQQQAPAPAAAAPVYSQPAHNAYSNGARSYQAPSAAAGGARKIATFGDD